MTLVDISGLQDLIRDFSEKRNWVSYHTPKNLTMALSGEVGELAAVIQWLDGPEAASAIAPDGALRQDFADEMADVMIYLARLAAVAEIDLNQAVTDKMARNEQRFRPGDPVV